MNKTQPITQLIAKISGQLHQVYDNTQLAESHAWWMLETITKKSRAQLLNSACELSQEQQRELERWLIAMIEQKMPIQYLIGHVPFLQLDINIVPPILIPRPETEWWCNLLIEDLTQRALQPSSILDLCTGSGVIGLALAQAFPKTHVWAVDIDQQAITLAQTNAQHNKINNIDFMCSDLYQKLLRNVKFDLITANPPYIDPILWDNLDPSVKHWENPHALIAEHHGLAMIEKIVAHAPVWLKPQGQLWIEIDSTQKDAVYKLFEHAGFHDITCLQDLAGRDRVIHGIL